MGAGVLRGTGAIMASIVLNLMESRVVNYKGWMQVAGSVPRL